MSSCAMDLVHILLLCASGLLTHKVALRFHDVTVLHVRAFFEIRYLNWDINIMSLWHTVNFCTLPIKVARMLAIWCLGLETWCPVNITGLYKHVCGCRTVCLWLTRLHFHLMNKSTCSTSCLQLFQFLSNVNNMAMPMQTVHYCKMLLLQCINIAFYMQVTTRRMVIANVTCASFCTFWPPMGQ